MLATVTATAAAKATRQRRARLIINTGEIAVTLVAATAAVWIIERYA